jgi:hypothetical protein
VNEHDKRQHGTSPLGERNGGAKLAQNQALVILFDRRKTTVISAHYGMGIRAVRKIKRGDRWSHLQPTLLDVAA